MKLRQLLMPPLVLLIASIPVIAQVASPSLNDQMWEAARKGDAAAVTALLDKGADVNAKFRYGATALFKAAERGNIDVVKVLLARGADVKVRDTFYGATAMTWALDNKHVEVVRALLEKDRESSGEVLMTGARENQVELVRVALDIGGAKPETLTSALVAATGAPEPNPEIVELLKKAGALPPPDIDAATLQSYVGKYKSEQGMEVAISLKDNKLFATPANQGPIVLMAVDKVTFKPAAFDGIVVTFKPVEGKVGGFDLKQGPNTTALKRVE
jgi:ankyrin repeat protein